MSQSDLAGAQRYSSEPAQPADPLNPQQRQTFDVLHTDILRTKDYAALREAVGRSQGFALCLVVCQVINAEQHEVLERSINEVYRSQFNLIMPLDDA